MPVRNKVALAVALALVCSLWAFGLAVADNGPLAQGDKYFAQRGNTAMLKKAVDSYEQAAKAAPSNPEPAWKLARALYRLGRKSPKEQQEAIFERAVNAAKQGIAIDPKNVPSHYWLAVSYGMYGSAKGVMKSLSLIDPIKEEAQFVIDHQPDYDQGGAYRVLGRLYFKVPGLFGGDNGLAVENLNKAIELGPKRYLSHIFLAEVYLDEGEDAKAKALLEQAVKGPTDPEVAPEDADWKQTAKKMLRNMK